MADKARQPDEVEKIPGGRALIIFGSGYVTISQMVKSGFGRNIIGIVITVAIAYLLVLPMIGVQVVPDWAMTVVK